MSEKEPLTLICHWYCREAPVATTLKVAGKEVEKTVGMKSFCTVKKSSVDDPFRTCEIYIMFGYGIDDIRGNLQYVKDMTGSTKYKAVDKEFQSMEKAIEHIEENKLQKDLKKEVITIWREIEQKFHVPRQEKIRE